MQALFQVVPGSRNTTSKEAEDITITVKPWQRVFESVVKGLDPDLWIVDEVRYGGTKLATSTTWEAEGNSSLCMCVSTLHVMNPTPQ